MRELLFDALILLAGGFAHMSFMLGLGTHPLPSLIIGITLGVVTILPERTRATAAAIGFLGVASAGAVVPRYAARAVSTGGNALALTAAWWVVLLLTFAIL